MVTTVDRLINEAVNSPCDEATPWLIGLDETLMKMKGNYDENSLLSIELIEKKLSQIKSTLINTPMDDISSQELSICLQKGRDAFLKAVFNRGGE